jgi:hypothetical protein
MFHETANYFAKMPAADSYYHAVELCLSNTIRLFGEISQRERSRARQQADMKKSIGSCLIRMQDFQISAC